MKSSTSFKVGHSGYCGTRNGFWKGDAAGYHAIHQWLRANFGKADRCENRRCVYPRRNRANKIILSPKGFDWALIRGRKYVHERRNFIRLCKSCHKRYDENKEEIEY